jgi:TetR/AcrR family transcriptional regulator, transcriptional repressor for nem operon
MKVSRAQAEQNRERIVATAGELFREKGFDGIGLNDLMQAAGLTRGGFYGHFESKQDLAVQACRQALAGNAEVWRERAGQLNDLAALVDFYLSDQHHDNRSRGCTLTALCADAARQGPELRAVFEQGVANFLRVLEPLVDAATPAQRRSTALAGMATLVGALLLSRAVADPGLSAEIRAAAGDAVLA